MRRGQAKHGQETWAVQETVDDRPGRIGRDEQHRTSRIG
jgi:hypothetical protein